MVLQSGLTYTYWWRRGAHWLTSQGGDRKCWRRTRSCLRRRDARRWYAAFPAPCWRRSEDASTTIHKTSTLYATECRGGHMDAKRVGFHSASRKKFLRCQPKQLFPHNLFLRRKHFSGIDSCSLQWGPRSPNSFATHQHFITKLISTSLTLFHQFLFQLFITLSLSRQSCSSLLYNSWVLMSGQQIYHSNWFECQVNRIRAINSFILAVLFFFVCAVQTYPNLSLNRFCCCDFATGVFHGMHSM